MHFVSHKVIHIYRFVRQNIHVNVHDYARCCEKVCIHAKNNASKTEKKPTNPNTTLQQCWWIKTKSLFFPPNACAYGIEICWKICGISAYINHSDNPPSLLPRSNHTLVSIIVVEHTFCVRNGVVCLMALRWNWFIKCTP